MPVYGIDNGNNKHEVYTTEELLAILQQAIDGGSLQGIDPEKNPIVAAVRESHNNSDVTFWSGTEAEFNELTGVTSELVGARIGSDGKLYILTGDTTLSDTVEAARQAALEATEGMKREVISVTLTAEGWTSTAPYKQTVQVPGMTADKDFLAPYIEPTGDESIDADAQNALSCISGGETSEGAVTFYCYEEKPTTTITIYMVDKGTKLEPSDYPIASASSLGMIKVGDNLSIESDGTLNAAAGGGSITVDSELSTTSTNPVQNKVINTALGAKANSSDVSSTYLPITTAANTYATKAQVNSLANGSPLTADSTEDMTDTTRVYVNTTDGHWYYYDGSAWADGGVYQASELADDSVSFKKILTHEIPHEEWNIIDPYNDLTYGGYINGQTGLVVSGQSGSGLCYYSDFIEVEPNTTYRRIGKSSGSPTAFGNVLYYDESKTKIGTAGNVSLASFTTTAETKYIRTSSNMLEYGIVKGDADNNTSLIPFSYSIEQLYERSNCFIEYRTTLSGGLAIDWGNNKITIRGCISCVIHNNKKLTILKSSDDAVSDYVLFQAASAGAHYLFWDTKSETIVSKTTVRTVKSLENRYVPLGYFNMSYKAAYINGYGSYSENTRGHVYYRPVGRTDYVQWQRSGTDVTISFPQGTFYILNRDGQYLASGTHPSHSAATYTLANGQKLMLNATTFEVYTQSLNNGVSYLNDGVDIMLLLNVNGKLQAGELLPDLLWQNVEFNQPESSSITELNTDNFFDYVFSSNYTPGEASDCTFVGDEVWFLHPSNDAHTDYALCCRYSIDFENKTATLLGTFQHNFGHCNTVDYCEATDTLILGNGGASSNTEPDQIFIIENASDLKNNSQNNLADVAKVIDLDDIGLDWGKQINVCWGEANNGAYNIAYVLSNDGSTKFIHKIILGKGSNVLENGTPLSVSDGEFNGTFNIIGTYTSDYSSTICNQGSQYYRGHLWEGIGHEGAWLHKSTLSQDGKIYRKSFKEKFYNAEGTAPYSHHEGIAIKDGYAIITQSSPAGDSRKLMVYKID